MEINPLKIVAVIFIAVGLVFGGIIVGVNIVYPVAQKEGYESAFVDLEEMFAEEDIIFNWTKRADGSYKIDIYPLYVYQLNETGASKLLFSFTTEFHLLSQQFRPWSSLTSSQQSEALNLLDKPSVWLCWVDTDLDGLHDSYVDDKFLIDEFYHAMSTTTGGKNWVEQQLFDSNASQNGLYLANSNASDSFSAAWTVIPSEITTDGLARAQGSYSSTGDGAANVTKTFSVSGTNSTKLYGLYYDSVASKNASLICAEQTGVGNQKNLNSGDSLKLTVQWSLS